MSRASTARSDFVCEVESQSDPGKTHEIRQTKQGTISCDCMAWRFSAGKGLSTIGDRWCKHLEGIKRQANRDGVYPKTEAALADYAARAIDRQLAAAPPMVVAAKPKPTMDPMARVLMDALYEVAAVRVMLPHAEAVWARIKKQMADTPVTAVPSVAASSVVDFARPRRRILVE